MSALRIPGPLHALVMQVSINNEVLVAVSNKNLAHEEGMLRFWIENVLRAGVKNAVVVALDNETHAFAEGLGMNALRMNLKAWREGGGWSKVPETQLGGGGRGEVGSTKFELLRRCLRLGYSVLLSDVDVLVLQDPFRNLTRDSDVESMTDGWTPNTAYGWNDVLEDNVMGWGRYAHSIRVFVLNVGFIYIRPTQASMDLLDMVIHRLNTEDGWDQAIFSECVFSPSRPGHKDPSVTRRVMDYENFLNSKTLFKHLRYEGQKYLEHRPYVVHINSHTDKMERMLASIQRYVNGNTTALDHFPIGS
ncbi:hypothetical protein APUTEX25_000833 [Auxenochlorella protothecoides]|uniref:Nucleotide-diphospho-sugar transferase domain-containing protein n=1 Tax=Auxenochlorella protothecoides TaxID=3075 RepID=A0A3M7KS76_AUXPR|nr:hypothetical protein APUTEX25_000833 [Auxenochlorella protothecoides]|eukprot:RMZ52714.1 hypothetical protein APUTEX25_000833 [Auxenochlorella protothecoides]